MHSFYSNSEQAGNIRRRFCPTWQWLSAPSLHCRVVLSIDLRRWNLLIKTFISWFSKLACVNCDMVIFYNLLCRRFRRWGVPCFCPPFISHPIYDFVSLSPRLQVETFHARLHRNSITSGWAGLGCAQNVSVCKGGEKTRSPPDIFFQVK